MVEKKIAFKKMDPIERLSAIGGDEPVETVALCHTFHQFTGGYEGSIHCHDEGKNWPARPR